MKKILIFAVIFMAVLWGIVLFTGDGTESNSSGSSGSIQSKVTIVNTKIPTSRWPDGRMRERWFDVTFKNNSNQDLGGRTVRVLVHYQDGKVASEDVLLGDSFSPGETRTRSVKVLGYPLNKDMYGNTLFSGNVPIKVEMAK